MFSDPIVLNSIIAGIALVAGPLLLKLFNRRDTSYDQIQEDLKEMRAERKSDREAAIAEREKDRAAARERDAAAAVEMEHLQELVRHLDDEVVKLRSDIQSGVVPPLPPREPWPKRIVAT